MPTAGTPARTDIACTNCNKNFVAELDLKITGNHVIECPWCGHHHYRKIEDGKVTDIRWDSAYQTVAVDKRSVWKAEGDVLIRTTIPGQFLRTLWLDRLSKQ